MKKKVVKYQTTVKKNMRVSLLRAKETDSLCKVRAANTKSFVVASIAMIASVDGDWNEAEILSFMGRRYSNSTLNTLPSRRAWIVSNETETQSNECANFALGCCPISIQFYNQLLPNAFFKM